MVRVLDQPDNDPKYKKPFFMTKVRFDKTEQFRENQTNRPDYLVRGRGNIENGEEIHANFFGLRAIETVQITSEVPKVQATGTIHDIGSRYNKVVVGITQYGSLDYASANLCIEVTGFGGYD